MWQGGREHHRPGPSGGDVAAAGLGAANGHRVRPGHPGRLAGNPPPTRLHPFRGAARRSRRPPQLPAGPERNRATPARVHRRASRGAEQGTPGDGHTRRQEHPRSPAGPQQAPRRHARRDAHPDHHTSRLSTPAARRRAVRLRRAAGDADHRPDRRPTLEEDHRRRGCHGPGAAPVGRRADHRGVPVRHAPEGGPGSGTWLLHRRATRGRDGALPDHRAALQGRDGRGRQHHSRRADASTAMDGDPAGAAGHRRAGGTERRARRPRGSRDSSSGRTRWPPNTNAVTSSSPPTRTAR